MIKLMNFGNWVLRVLLKQFTLIDLMKFGFCLNLGEKCYDYDREDTGSCFGETPFNPR